jgi:hypothetical protein
METSSIIITIILISTVLFSINTYIKSTYKDPLKSLKHAEIYFDEMLFSQAKITLKRSLKYNQNHSDLLARLHEYENEKPDKK